MTKSKDAVRKKRLEAVGYTYYLSDQRFSLNGNPQMYHVVPKESASVDGRDIIHLEDARVVDKFIQVRRAANAAHSLEDAQKIMQEGGF